MITEKRKREGFTLAELLIVVAIIAVLVAISIPVFTGQLEKARLAVDHSAIQDAYALIQVANNTETVEIDGVSYTYSQLHSMCTGNTLPFVVNKDLSSLINIAGIVSLTPPENAYLLKENGGNSEGNCNTCAEIGKNIASGFLPLMHIKGLPIYAYYSRQDNLIYLGQG